MTDNLNEQVEGTAFAGRTKSRIETLEGNVEEIRADVKHIRGKIDMAAGFAIGLSSLGFVTGIIAIWRTFP